VGISNPYSSKRVSRGEERKPADTLNLEEFLAESEKMELRKMHPQNTASYGGASYYVSKCVSSD